MIKKLHLNNFGRFRGKSFELQPVTLFFGHNESGKTTIFDALFDSVCKPKGTTEGGKLLNARYTTERDSSVEYLQDNPLKIEEADFLNLFAIRSGKIDVDTKKAKWQDTVKASLFTGEIDPQSVVEELDKAVSEGRAKGSLIKQRDKITSELKDFEYKKEEAEKKRKDCLEAEKRIANAEQNLNKNADEINFLNNNIQDLERIIEQQRLIQMQKDVKNKLAELVKLRLLKDEQEKYSPYKQEKLNELKDKDTEIQKLKNETEKVSALEEETLRLLKNNIDEKALIINENINAEKMDKLSNELKQALIPREKLVSTKTKLSWKKLPIALSGLFLILGVMAILFLQHINFLYIGAFALSFVCLFVSFTRKTIEDTSALENAVKNANEKWKQQTGEDIGYVYEDILAAIGRASERSLAAKMKYNQIIENCARLEQEKNNRALQKQKAMNSEDELRRIFRELLNEAGVANIDEYAVKLAKKQNMVEQYNELANMTRNALEEYNAATVTELEGVLNNKLIEYSGKITDEEISQNELQAKKNTLNESKKKLEILQMKEKESIKSVHLDIGSVREQFKGLSETIADCEKNIEEKNTLLNRINIDIKAGKIAQEIFSSIAKDSGVMFEKLSAEISEQFHAITENKQVNMESFDIENANIGDGTDTVRKNDCLSAGTRDSFLLAARLVLASKTVNEKAFIILDEPFLTLDKPRTKRALMLLKEFYDKTAWQIILFTKEEEILEQAINIFRNEIKIHKL